MYHSFLNHSSADGHLGCFHVLAIINSAVMNIGVHVSLSDLVSSVCMPRSGIAGSYGSSNSSFLRRNLHTENSISNKFLHGIPIYETDRSEAALGDQQWGSRPSHVHTPPHPPLSPSSSEHWNRNKASHARRDNWVEALSSLSFKILFIYLAALDLSCSHIGSSVFTVAGRIFLVAASGI